MNTNKVIRDLFRSARNEGGVQYVYTVSRVSGMSYNTPDRLLELEQALRNTDDDISGTDALAEHDRILEELEEPFSLVANLLDCAAGSNYTYLPFLHLYTGDLLNRVKPSPMQMISELREKAKGYGRPEVDQLIARAFPDRIMHRCVSEENTFPTQGSTRDFRNLRAFLSSLIEVYREERLSYKEEPRFCRLADNAVLELLVDPTAGLYGFKAHFYGGSTATYARYPDRTECINVNPVGPVVFGFDEAEPSHGEWRIEGRRLYELGFGCRYNRLGKWRPIIYPGDAGALQKEALSLSDDPDVQGQLFYVLCTGCLGVEFVVRTAMQFPMDFMTLDGKLHLWKCQVEGGDDSLVTSPCIYDGWFELGTIDPEAIEIAIGDIGAYMNLLAFTYNEPIHWRLKYRMRHSPDTRIRLDEESLDSLETMLQQFRNDGSARALDAAIEWYNLGRSTRSVFTAFLCYYIAVESIGDALWKGEVTFSRRCPPRGANDSPKDIVACIRGKFDQLYAKDPIKFVEKAYLSCIRKLEDKTRYVMEFVFGPDHACIHDVFDEAGDGYSLYRIRGEIAHGGLSPYNREHEKLVSERLPRLAQIARQFLMRLVLDIGPEGTVPTARRSRSVGGPMDDPRMTMVANRDDWLPSKDWRIRPEWCE